VAKSEHKRSVRGTQRGDRAALQHSLLGLAALLLEIASKSTNSQSTNNGTRAPAPSGTGPEAVVIASNEGADHTETEVSH
jgi:hypothetical protein